MAVKSPTKVKPIDWSRLIFDLEALGMSQRQIGVECGMSTEIGGTWVNRLKNIPGTQPKYHAGALLLGLWAEKTGQLTLEAPKEK